MMHSNSFYVGNQSPSMLRNDSWSGDRMSLNKKKACKALNASYKKGKYFSKGQPSRNRHISGFLLEPTPIAPSRMNIVPQFDVTTSRLASDSNIFESCLLPLLKKTEVLSMNNRIGQSSNDAVSDHCTSMNRNHDLDFQLELPTLVSADDLTHAETAAASSLTRNRESHLEKWSQRFRDLIEFRKMFGHCLVPLEWPHNPSLAHWIKRQRYQYKAKVEGKHSTLSDERHEALEELGFIWDSHKASWEERLNEIKDFKSLHGHTNVPNKFVENPQLSIWVKCQRRQYKLFLESKKSNMTLKRIARLVDIGFVWTPRSRRHSSSSSLSNL